MRLNRTRAHLYECGGGVQVAAETGVYQGRVAVAILLVELGVALQQELHHLHTQARQRRRGGRLSVKRRGHAHLQVVILAGQVKGRGLAVAARVHVGAAADEKRRQLPAAVRAGHVEGSHAVRVGALRAQRAARNCARLKNDNNMRATRRASDTFPAL